MVTACNLFTEDHMLLVKARRKAIVLLRRTIIFFKFGPFPVSFWIFFGSLCGLQLTNFDNGDRKQEKIKEEYVCTVLFLVLWKKPSTQRE